MSLHLLFPSGEAGCRAEPARLHRAEQQLCASRAGQAAAGEPGRGACFARFACCACCTREDRSRAAGPTASLMVLVLRIRWCGSGLLAAHLVWQTASVRDGQQPQPQPCNPRISMQALAAAKAGEPGYPSEWRLWLCCTMFTRVHVSLAAMDTSPHSLLLLCLALSFPEPGQPHHLHFSSVCCC